VIGGDGHLIIPPGTRLLCRECDKEEPNEVEDDF
jgi:hypothetical protein